MIESRASEKATLQRIVTTSRIGVKADLSWMKSIT